MNPFFVLAASKANSVSNTLTSHVTSSILAPVDRTMGYRVNVTAPNLGVGPDDLINLYWRGYIDYLPMKEALNKWGISTWEHDADQNWGHYWSKILESKKPQPNPETVLWLLKMGFLGTGEVAIGKAKQLWMQSGVVSKQDMDYMIEATPALSADELRYGILKGTITKDYAKKQLAASGYSDEDTAEMVLDYAPTISLGDAIDLRRRKWLPDNVWNDILARSGITETHDILAMNELLKQIPPPTDIVQYAVKDAWDPAIVAKFRYDEDFPDELQYWLEKQGLGWKEDITKADGTVIPGVPWPVLLWRSHWRNIAPTQAYQMQQRLAPDVVWRWQEIVPGVQPWLVNDTKDLLKVNDYAPAFRDRLSAIAYNHLGVRVVKRISAFSNIPEIFEQVKRYDRNNPAPTQESAIQAFGEYQARDQGLAPDDAKLYGSLVKMEYIKERDKIHAARRTKLDNNAANQQLELYRLGLKLREATVRTLVNNFSWQEPTARLAVTDIDTDERIKCYKLLYTRCKADYFSGTLNRKEAVNRLMSAGVDEEVAERNVKCWTMNFTWKRRQLTTQQVLDMHCKGLINYNSARERLANIGWDNPEDLLLLGTAQLCILNQQTKAFKAQQLAKKQQAAQLAKLIKEQQAAIKQQQAKLTKMTPVSLLDKLAKKGEITYKWYKSRMSAMGFDATGILLRWESMFPPPDTLASMEAKVKSGTIKIKDFVSFLRTSEYDDDEIRKEVENVLGPAALSDPAVPAASQEPPATSQQAPGISGQPEPQ